MVVGVDTGNGVALGNGKVTYRFGFSRLDTRLLVSNSHSIWAGPGWILVLTLLTTDFGKFMNGYGMRNYKTVPEGWDLTDILVSLRQTSSSNGGLIWV